MRLIYALLVGLAFSGPAVAQQFFSADESKMLIRHSAEPYLKNISDANFVARCGVLSAYQAGLISGLSSNAIYSLAKDYPFYAGLDRDIVSMVEQAKADGTDHATEGACDTLLGNPAAVAQVKDWAFHMMQLAGP